MNVVINALRADSRIRSQDRRRRGARPARHVEGEQLAVTNPVGWIFAAARTDRTQFSPSQYIDAFNRGETEQGGMDRRPNPEVVFESALTVAENKKQLHKKGEKAELQGMNFRFMPGTWYPPDTLFSSHPRTPDRGAGSAAGPDARRCDAVIAALFQGVATQQTGLPRPNPPTGGVLGWELFTYDLDFNKYIKNTAPFLSTKAMAVSVLKRRVHGVPNPGVFIQHQIVIGNVKSREPY